MRILAPCLLLLVACGSDPDAPHIDAITPTAGAPGTSVTITGSSFCGERVDCDPAPVAYVSFGIDPLVTAGVTSWTEDRIVAIVPNEATGAVTVVVTVDGRSSNGVPFTIQ